MPRAKHQGRKGKGQITQAWNKKAIISKNSFGALQNKGQEQGDTQMEENKDMDTEKKGAKGDANESNTVEKDKEKNNGKTENRVIKKRRDRQRLRRRRNPLTE